MSIAITAPQKFAFQDLVCLEMMLRFHADGDATFVLEPDGGEDGELVSTASGRRVQYEIQVKGAEGSVTLANVAACLAHTPPRRANDTLLERLVADSDRVAVIVMSGRADDGVSLYLGATGWRGEPHAESRIKVAQVDALLAAFAVADVAGGEKGKLRARRKAHNAAAAKRLERSAVRDALRRVVVFENIDDKALAASCEECLRRDFRIPSDRVAAVLRELREAIAEAKSKRIDAYALLRRILARESPPPILPENYLNRGDEAALIDELSKSGVLLLSGTPRVGKTYAARRVASEFMPLGYDVREFSDVDAAERYLSEPGSALRLALLNDPLGGSHIEKDATRFLSRLDNLIVRLRPHRKLVVAQGLEALLATARLDALDRVITGGRRWRDLSGLDRVFLVGVWQSLVQQFGVDVSLSVSIADALSAGELELEPGCLAHLAGNIHRLGASSTTAEVARLAREDAAQLGHALAAEGLERLAVCLAIATTPREPVEAVELAYVRGNGGDGRPGKRTAEAYVVSIGGPADPPTAAPTYDAPPELDPDDKDGIDKLQRRGLIEIDPRARFGYAHPFYRAAGECLLVAPTHYAGQAIVAAVGRGILCLAPSTSRATARNLDWIFAKLEDRPAERESIVACAVEGLASIFPATRDLCFRFLMYRWSDLSETQRAELPRWIGKVTAFTLDELEWSDGEAHLPYGEDPGIDFFEQIIATVERRDVADDLAMLDSADSAVSSERAAKALRYLAEFPNAMTSTMVGRLLSYEEAALRAEATKIWLSESRKNDDDILVRIFSDDHPLCALAALEGAIAGWHACVPARQARQLAGLADLARNIAAAASMLGKLVLFGRVEHTGERTPWPIFERVMPVVLSTLPHNAFMNDARLFESVRSAIGLVEAPRMVELCDGWISWLERNENVGDLPSDFALGVADLLVGATESNPDLREFRVRRLLEFRGTGFKIPFVKDLVDHWSSLRDDERAEVLAFLVGDRVDRRWFQAVALTRRKVPAEIAEQLLPEGVSLSDSPPRLLDLLQPTLVEAIVYVYCGKPQPLWWLGTHHSGRETWEPVIELIARRPDHPLFEFACGQVIEFGEEARVTRLISDLGAAHADRVFDVLLRQKVATNGDFMPEAWATLLRLAADPGTYDSWIDRMAEAAPAILYELGDFKQWLKERKNIEALTKRLKSDYAMIEYVGLAAELPDNPETRLVWEKVTTALEALIIFAPPVLLPTCDFLIRLVPAEASVLRDLLEERREAIFEEIKRIETGFVEADPPLHSWVDP